MQRITGRNVHHLQLGHVRYPGIQRHHQPSSVMYLGHRRHRRQGRPGTGGSQGLQGRSGHERFAVGRPPNGRRCRWIEVVEGVQGLHGAALDLHALSMFQSGIGRRGERCNRC